jgi:hypothetical protein
MRRSAAIMLAAAWLLPGPARAQDSVPVRVIRDLRNGSYVVLIRGDTMLAITQQMARQSLTLNADLAGARQEAAAKDSLLRRYEFAVQWYDSTVTRQRKLIAELDSLYRGYRDVAAGYKRLSGEPWLTFTGGLGATGKDHRPSILMGIGIRRVLLWGFLQEANAGGGVGVSLRLF